MATSLANHKSPVFVITESFDDDGWKIESTKQIDHANASDRKWLGNHTFWAMRNNRKVTYTPMNV